MPMALVMSDNQIDHYKLSLPCTRADAETINKKLEIDNQWTDNSPTVVARETIEFDNDSWVIEIYLTQLPDERLYTDLARLMGRPIDSDIQIDKFMDEDWVTLSQSGLEAITIGQFHIHNSQQRPLDGKTNIEISAGQAFGTGHHYTTSGCLAALNKLHQQGQNYSNIADIGTGTGLLAFVAKKLWPDSAIMASDSDPVAVDFAIKAAQDNRISTGSESSDILMLCASGTDHDAILNRAPYDLVIANILAGPLIELAPAFHHILAKDGLLILAGLLDSQLKQVVDAYQAMPMQLIEKDKESHWPILIFKKTDDYRESSINKTKGRTSQKDGDYGEW